MSGTTMSPISVTLTAVDKTGATFDKFGARLKAMTSPADKLNQSVSRLGDTSAVNRLGLGMQNLAGRSLDVFRSLDRVTPLMAGLAGATTLAGITALSQRWADLGQNIANTGKRLGMPTDRLTALQGAARLAGSTSEDLTTGLGALDEKLRGATFRGDGEAIQTFNKLGVNFGQIGVKARNAGDAFGDVAEGIKRLYDSGEAGRGAALRAAQNLGIENLLPLLLKGKSGIRDLQAEVARLGGVITPAMAQRATELHTSFAGLETAIGGIENRLGDAWGQAVKPYIDSTADWIGKNQTLADSYGKVGAGILALGLIKPASWLARLLGITELAPLTPLLLRGDTNPNATPDGFRQGWIPDNGPTATPYMGATETFGGMLSREWTTHAPTWLGGSRSADAAVPAQRISVPGIPSTSFIEMTRSHSFWASKGLKEFQIAGILSNEAAESGGNASRWNDDHTSFGLYQMTGSRLRAMQARYGTSEPSADQQREYAWDELNGPEREARRGLFTSTNAREAGSAFTHFERPAGENQRARERGDAAPLFEGRFGDIAAAPGKVDGAVDVHIKLDVSGHPVATATAQSSGHARASAPNVAMPMAGIGGDYSRGY